MATSNVPPRGDADHFKDDAATELWKLAEMGMLEMHLVARTLVELLQAFEADDDELLDELVPRARATLRWIDDQIADTRADIELAADPDWLARLLRGEDR
jgi:hypothetical protein